MHKFFTLFLAIIIDQPWAVFKHYVRSWKFALDFSSVLPIEVFSLVWKEPWKYMALYKLNRILKWWKVGHVKQLHVVIVHTFVTALAYT